MKLLYLYILSTSLVFACTSNNRVVLPSAKDEVPLVQSTQKYDVLVQKDVVYAKGLSHERINSDEATTMSLMLDVYMPENEIQNRPVFVFIHGGGFAGGSKQQQRIIEWANYYASRGWVFISIDYRLKKHKGTVPQSWVDYSANVPNAKAAQFLAIYPAHRDAKAAIRWVVANAKTYQINPKYMTVGGGSAGAITAISMGVSNPKDFTCEVDVAQDPTLKSTHQDHSFQVSTIVNLWGSKVALDALENIIGQKRFDSDDPAIFLAHGTEDSIVAFSNAKDLKAIYEANERPFAYYPLEGKGHGAWGATIGDKPLEKLAFDFIVEQQGLIVE